MQYSCEEESPIGNDPIVVDSTEITNEEIQKEQSGRKRQRYKKQKTNDNNNVKVKFKKFIRDRYELSESSMSAEDGISVPYLCQLFSSMTNTHVDYVHATNYLQSLFHLRLRIWGKEPRRVNLKEKTLQTYCLETIALKDHHQLISCLKDIHKNNSLEKTLMDEVIWTAITNKMITRYELIECGWVVSICKLTTEDVLKAAPAENPLPEITVNTKWNEIKKSQPQEPKTKDFDYDALLTSCKQFFHPRIKSLPCHATKFGSENNNSGGALPFTSKNLLPRIYDMYGSYEYFFRCLLACSETKQWMKAVLEAQEESLQSTMQKAIQDARHMGRIEATEEIQKRFHLVGPTLQEGCRISKAGYLKQKSTVELESFESAYQREIYKDEHTRQPVPFILSKHRDFILAILNDLLLPLVTNSSKITWKVVTKQLSDRVAVRTDADLDLTAWLCTAVNRKSHIKTIYLSQAICHKSWIEQVQSKGVIRMTPSDWEAIQPSLGGHASFILRQNYNRLTKINPLIRRRKILLFDSIPLTLYSTVDMNSKKIDRQLLGGQSVGDPDPATKMNCSEFIQHIKDGRIYYGKMC